MPAMPRFRKYEEGDYPELKSMILALYEEDSYGQPMTEEKINLTLQELTNHPHKGQVIIFSDDEIITGYAIIINFWSNEYGGNIVTIDEIYVKPAYRRRGIGTAFLDYLIGKKDPSVRGLQLEVTPSNERAFTYYVKQGFTPAGNRHLFKMLKNI